MGRVLGQGVQVLGDGAARTALPCHHVLEIGIPGSTEYGTQRNLCGSTLLVRQFFRAEYSLKSTNLRSSVVTRFTPQSRHGATFACFQWGWSAKPI